MKSILSENKSWFIIISIFPISRLYTNMVIPLRPPSMWQNGYEHTVSVSDSVMNKTESLLLGKMPTKIIPETFINSATRVQSRSINIKNLTGLLLNIGDILEMNNSIKDNKIIDTYKMFLNSNRKVFCLLISLWLWKSCAACTG